MVDRRLDCENCRHLTVVGLHDTGPWLGVTQKQGFFTTRAAKDLPCECPREKKKEIHKERKLKKKKEKKIEEIERKNKEQQQQIKNKNERKEERLKENPVYFTTFLVDCTR